jgi:hypothetical protein
MLVPPRNRSPAVNFSACSRFSGFAGSSDSANGRASVLNGTMPKRSEAFRFFRQKSSAFRAWSSLPPSMLPDVSSTNTTSFGSGGALPSSGGGVTNARK